MAKKKSEEYISKAKTTAIRFTSRASIKYRDNFYTLECCEERSIPDLPDVDIIKEKELLWEAVNNEIDDQIQDLKNFLKSS